MYYNGSTSLNSTVLSKYLTIPINSNVILSNYFSFYWQNSGKKDGKPMIVNGVTPLSNNLILCTNTLWKTTASKTGKDFNFNQKLTSDVTIYGYCNNQ